MSCVIGLAAYARECLAGVLFNRDADKENEATMVLLILGWLCCLHRLLFTSVLFLLIWTCKIIF